MNTCIKNLHICTELAGFHPTKKNNEMRKKLKQLSYLEMDSEVGASSFAG